jgi:hypothetical protein
LRFTGTRVMVVLQKSCRIIVIVVVAAAVVGGC